MTTDSSQAFPYVVPSQTPDRDLSAAMRRCFTHAAGLRPAQNPLFTNFKYTPLEGLDYHGGDGTLSRRDPSKIIFEDGKYHVWYTRRATEAPPLGMSRAREATDTIASADWDLAEIWHATSADGFVWQEQSVAVARPPKPAPGWRSVCTPDILKWQGHFYLYFQSFVEPSGLRGDYCPVSVAHADSPDGPWMIEPGVVIPNGQPGAWDQYAVHDPYLLVHDGKIYCYYKSVFNRPQTMWLAQGLAVAEHPLGPFEKHPLNPVMNSGHETMLFPFREGVAALVIRDGPEHYTVQYAPDWVNFEPASIVELPPTAGGPYVPDAFTDTEDGQGIRWGLCHFVNAGTSSTQHSVLARFDCDLHQRPDAPSFKSTTYLHKPDVYYGQALSHEIRQRRAAEAMDVEASNARATTIRNSRTKATHE